MTITYPRTLPTELVIEQATIAPTSVVAVAKSPFTGEEQVYAHQGQWWGGRIEAALAERANAAPVIAWLASMNGREKTFLFGDPAAVTARGSASSTPGSPIVKTGGQTGNALSCGGGPLSATNYLRSGDYIQLGSGATSRLYMSLGDVNTDGSGDFTVDIWPNLRASTISSAVVVVASAVGRFRLASNVNSWDERTVTFGVTFDIIEAT